MKPFFQDAATTLFRGDALGILRNLQDDSVDAVLTDPPYSSGGMTLSARQADPRVKYQHTRTVKTYPPMLGTTGISGRLRSGLRYGSRNAGGRRGREARCCCLRTGGSCPQ